MFKLRNLVILGVALVLSAATYANTEATTKATEPTAAAAPAASTTEATTATTEIVKVEKSAAIAKINLNTANAKELGKVKGFGAKKAKAIVEYRTKNGEFKSVEDLLKVKSKGINKKWLEKISAHVEV